MDDSSTRYVEGLPRLGRCLVMGVLNVTPDSFSDGGRYLDPGSAVGHGVGLHRRGADLVDVGGESTRPGAERVAEEEELRRVLPVVAGLAEAGVLVSVDTMRASVARAAVSHGAVLVNDVSGGLADPRMLDTVAELGVPVALMHWRGHAATMQQQATYDDVVDDVRRELGLRLDAAVAAGVDPAKVALDPGLGFAKTADHNWALLAGLARLQELGCPLLLGTSRKRFLGELLAVDGAPRPVDGREDATTATTALAAAAGVWCVRVHEVGGAVDAARVAARWAAG